MQADQEPSTPKDSQSIRISGASGMVGTELTQSLQAQGMRVTRFVRSAERAPDEFPWQPGSAPDSSTWQGVDAFVHLAGDNIADGRWNDAKKKRIRESRVAATRALCESMAQSSLRPKTMVCASAIGIYGSRGAQWLDEDSKPGEGFLADVCREWEAACDPARAAGIRVVHARLGLVLSKKGGALTKMLTPFKLGLGGRIGDGEQYWSWVHLKDVVGSFEHALANPNLVGPMNVTAPNPVTNREFTGALGSVLSRPTFLPLPATAARLALGREMANDLLLASGRVRPKALLEDGYPFRFENLKTALENLLT